jgi:hypothetical protein
MFSMLKWNNQAKNGTEITSSRVRGISHVCSLETHHAAVLDPVDITGRKNNDTFGFIVDHPYVLWMQ